LSRKEPLKQLDSAGKMRGSARESWKAFVTETAIAEIEVEEDEAVVEAAISAIDLPGTIPGRSRHQLDRLTARVITIATGLYPEKQTLTCPRERAVGEGVGDASVPPLSRTVVLARHRLIVHLHLAREELHGVIPQVSAAAVVLQSIGIQNDPLILHEESAGTVNRRPIHEDAHHLQSVEEIQAHLPGQDAIAHVHLLELD
ncbi:hypothetical protein KCU66_g12885, partial [Aureobasidium melanogenum]